MGVLKPVRAFRTQRVKYMVEELQSLGIEKRAITALKKKDINTVTQLLHYFPKEYYDYRRIVNIDDARPEYLAAVCGKLDDMERKMGSKCWYI